MLNVPFVSTMRSIWQSTRASALPFPSMRSRSELAATRPREGPSQRPTDPMATTEISAGCSGSSPRFSSRSMESKLAISSSR